MILFHGEILRLGHKSQRITLYLVRLVDSDLLVGVNPASSYAFRSRLRWPFLLSVYC
jgi:hypothetical protein